MTRTVRIIDDKTGKVERTIDTTLTGRNYETFLLGLYRKVDQERFTIVEDDEWSMTGETKP